MFLRRTCDTSVKVGRAIPHPTHPRLFGPVTVSRPSVPFLAARPRFKDDRPVIARRAWHRDSASQQKSFPRLLLQAVSGTSREFCDITKLASSSTANFSTLYDSQNRIDMLTRTDPIREHFLAQKPSGCSPLGRLLAAARAIDDLTQAALAARARCSIRAVWQAERGQGNTDIFGRLANAMDMAIDGRSLPPGDNVGARLLALRTRLGTSRAQLSAACGVSRTTIAAMEAGQSGHLTALERVGEALGARLTLSRQGEPPAFYSSAATSSAWDAWASPVEILDRLYGALGGGFDIDPCSPGRGRSRVQAKIHFTKDDDGLALPWYGRIYMNPPYNRGIGLWTAKARSEAESGRSSLVIGLVPCTMRHRLVASRHRRPLRCLARQRPPCVWREHPVRALPICCGGLES